MIDRTKSLISEAKRIFPDLVKLEERLADEPETIIAQAFPSPESNLQARSIVSLGLEAQEFEIIDTGLHRMRRNVLEHARLAVEKVLTQGEDAELEPEEEVGLEAIIRAEGRPAILIKNGSFSTPPPIWQILEEVRNSVEEVCQSVGRIEINHPLVDFAGTGFLVADDIIMTNRHVAEMFCQRYSGCWTFDMDYQPSINYLHEWGISNKARFRITELIDVHNNKKIDLALFRVVHESEDNVLAPKPLTLASEYDTREVSRDIYTIGYPYSREGDPEFLSRIFGDIYGYKRLQPGKTIDVIEEKYQFRHDCSTLGGNSGSCVVDLETSQVIGLHFGGRYLQANKAVALWMLQDDSLLRRAGVNFDQ